MKLGLQLYTVRGSFATEEMARATFKKLRELGYEEAQTAGCYDFDYALFYEMAHDAGIEIVGTHDNFDMMKNDIDTAIENHKKLHTTNMGIGGFWPSDVKSVEEMIESANKIGARIAKEGMKFTYHNHSQEFLKLENGKSTMDMLIEGLDPETTSFVLDTHWVQNAGGDVCDWIERLKGRIDILHLKDMGPRLDENHRVVPNIVPCGKGYLNFEKIIATAQKCGVKYYCVEQDNCPADYIADVKASADHLLSIMKKF